MNTLTDNKTQRSFIPGQEWLYYKFYTGGKMGDKIITHLILPLTQELEKEGLIEKWFFIRYRDELGSHLRFRVQVPNPDHMGSVLTTVQKNIEPFIEKRWIWKVQTDTYQRELERYGTQTIKQAEEIFFYNSKMTAHLLTQIVSDEDEIKRWLICLVGIDKLFNSFGYTLDERHQLLQIMKNAFATEFSMDDKLKDQLNKKYETHRIEIENIFKPQVLDTQSQSIISMINMVDHFTKPLESIAAEIRTIKENGNLPILIHDLLWSYIHMFVNRLFKSRQRVHELVLYDFLYRQYTAMREKTEPIHLSQIA